MDNLVSFCVDESVISVEKVYVENSPFLVKMLETEVSVDKDEEGNIILDVNADIFDNYVSFLRGEEFRMNEDDQCFFDFMGHPNTMQYPLDYWKVKLQDNWIRNNMYKLKLWRDPYYGLVEVPIVRHEQVTMLGSDKEMPYIPSVGTVIAGSTALWMSGNVREHNDTDHFFVCTKEEAERILIAAIGNQDCDVGKHAITCGFPTAWYMKMQYILRLYKVPTEVVHGFDVDCCGILYDPMTMKLWATKRAAYAITHKVNYFDPERASPSYEWRLCKYKTRGYDIGFPLLTEDQINVKPFLTKLANLFFTDGLDYMHQGGEAHDLDKYIVDTDLQVPPVHDIMNHISFKLKDRLGDLGMNADQASLWRKEIDLATDHLFQRMYTDLREHLNSARERIMDEVLEHQNLHMSINPLIREIASHASFPVDYVSMFKMSQHMEGMLHTTRVWGTVINILRGCGSRYRDQEPCEARYKVRDIIPKDPASILILSKFLNISTYLWKQSDYNPDTKVQKMHEVEYKSTITLTLSTGVTRDHEVEGVSMQPIISEIQWKEQDPMTQVTSTFHPMPISDIHAWLSQSPLYLS